MPTTATVPLADTCADAVEQTEAVHPWVTIVWNDPVNLMSYVTWVFRTYFGFPRTRAEHLHHQVLSACAGKPEVAAEHPGDVAHQVHRVVPHDRDPGVCGLGLLDGVGAGVLQRHRRGRRHASTVGLDGAAGGHPRRRRRADRG